MLTRPGCSRTIWVASVLSVRQAAEQQEEFDLSSRRSVEFGRQTGELTLNSRTRQTDSPSNSSMENLQFKSHKCRSCSCVPSDGGECV